MACHEDAAKDCEIENWCVCQWAWEMYVKKQGCENIVDLHCESVNMKALEACASCTSRTNARSHPGPTSQSARVPSASLARAQRVPSACPARAPAVADESDPTEHAEALACLKAKCPGIGKARSTAHVLAAH